MGRIEQFIEAIIKGTTPPDPISREELFLAKIAGADIVPPKPVFRREYYLAKIAGMDCEIPTPIFREDFYLAAIAGADIEVPDPVYSMDKLLYKWLEKCRGSENGEKPTE